MKKLEESLMLKELTLLSGQLDMLRSGRRMFRHRGETVAPTREMVSDRIDKALTETPLSSEVSKN